MSKREYINPFEVFDGSNQLMVHANHISKNVAGASVQDCIEAAVPLMGAIGAMIGPVSGRLTHIVTQEAPRRDLKPIDGPTPLIKDDPDADFRLWATAADAYYVLKGQPHGRFRYTSAREMFSGYYQGGWSAIKAFEHLDAKMRKNQRPVRPSNSPIRNRP